jgi:hypothetical protein
MKTDRYCIFSQVRNPDINNDKNFKWELLEKVNCQKCGGGKGEGNGVNMTKVLHMQV